MATASAATAIGIDASSAGRSIPVETLISPVTVAMAPIRPPSLLLPADNPLPVPRRFGIAPRLTAHVRHRHKYVDTPVPAGRGFVFTRRGEPIGPPARTLAAFVASLNRAADDVIAEHVRRGDFSRWIADVFGDARLAAWIRDLEQRGAGSGETGIAPALEAAVRERYCIM